MLSSLYFSQAETKALVTALQQTCIRGFKSVCFEGDCEIFINIVNKSLRNCTLTNLLQDIYHWIWIFERQKSN